jgi:hypothetical protein
MTRMKEGDDVKGYWVGGEMGWKGWRWAAGREEEVERA